MEDFRTETVPSVDVKPGDYIVVNVRSIVRVTNVVHADHWPHVTLDYEIVGTLESSIGLGSKVGLKRRVQHNRALSDEVTP